MRLTVKPLKQKDAGRGLAALDREAIEELDLEGGDYIRIDGSNGTAIARVWPGYPEDTGTGVVRIDGRLRQQANVGIDDTVDVEAADIKPAKSVSVALPQNLRISGNIGGHLRDKLAGQPVTAGQNIRVPFGFGFMSSSNQPIPLKIASTDPDGTVVVTDSTEVSISQTPAEEIQSGGDPSAATCVESATPAVRRSQSTVKIPRDSRNLNKASSAPTMTAIIFASFLAANPIIPPIIAPLPNSMPNCVGSTDNCKISIVVLSNPLSQYKSLVGRGNHLG